MQQITENCWIVPVGEMGNLCTVCRIGERVMIVDPGWEAGKIIAALEELQLQPTDILLTHVHADHSGQAETLQQQFRIPIWMHPSSMQKHGLKMGSWLVPSSTKDLPADGMLIINELIVVATPGHQRDHVSYYLPQEKVLIAGDALFVDGCGRVDLPDSDPALQQRTLKYMREFPSDTVLIPGHDYGPTTTDLMGNQYQTNPYLNPESDLYQQRFGSSNT